MKRTITFLISTILASQSFAQGVDYRSGNSNPFANYQYKSEAAWQNDKSASKSQAYNINSNNITRGNNISANFSSSISNPVTVVNKKYKHLIANSSQLNGCWDKAAATYKVDPWLLMAIAQVESGFNSMSVNRNTNKSTDLGMMQINTIWLPTLKKYGIEAQHLFQPCTSVFVGAWIVAQNIRSFGYNQDGIGAYNSPRNVPIRRAYAKKVYAAYNQLITDFRPTIVQR